MTGSLRYRICPDCGEMHDREAWPDNHRRFDEVLCAPAVIRDEMPAIRSMGNGQIYDSKSEIRKHYKRDGYEEIGNDPARLKPFQKPKPDAREIRTSIEKARARLSNGEMTERGKRIEITRTGRKPPKHVEPSGPPMPRGVFKPAFA